MQRHLLWFAAAVPVILFASYLALTTGTRILLPDAWNALSLGTTREEARARVPELRSMNHFEPSREDFEYATRKIGLRDWTIELNFKDGRIAKIEYFALDPHHSISLWRRRL